MYVICYCKIADTFVKKLSLSLSFTVVSFSVISWKHSLEGERLLDGDLIGKVVEEWSSQAPVGSDNQAEGLQALLKVLDQLDKDGKTNCPALRIIHSFQSWKQICFH